MAIQGIGVAGNLAVIKSFGFFIIDPSRAHAVFRSNGKLFQDKLPLGRKGSNSAIGVQGQGAK